MAESMLDILMEDASIQEMVNEKEVAQMITEGDDALVSFTQVIKDEVQSNPTKFLGETVQETVENISVFTEGAISAFANQLTDQMVDVIVT